MSYRLGANIEINGKSTIDFCYLHYRNDTFLATVNFNGDDAAQPKECDDSQWRTKGYFQSCNSTCFDNYHKCLEENATKEQIEFQKCHWMGADYFITAGTGLFKYFVPLLILVMMISVIYSKNTEEELNRKVMVR